MFDQSNPTVCTANLDSPLSLENYVINFICDHIEDICVIAPQDSNSTSADKPFFSSSTSSGDDNSRFGRSSDEKTAPSPPDDVNDGTQEDEDEEDEPMDHESSEQEFFEAVAKSFLRSTAKRLEDNRNKKPKILKFPRDEIFFPSELSEQLLQRLCERRQINDLNMSLFDESSTKLRNVRIDDASRLTPEGLKTLSKHKIVELECVGLTQATVGQLIEILNEWTLSNCRLLNVSRSTFVDHRKETVLTSLSNFQRLASLNLSYTKFNKASLEMIVQDLPLLDSLDISCTSVTDISSLLLCKHRLRSLSMYGLKLPYSEKVIDVLSQLYELRHLDISDDKDDDPPFGSGKLKIEDFLKKSGSWPNLISLDISGKDNIHPADLKKFMLDQNQLKFIGLMLTDACKDEIFQLPGSNLIVSGSANEAQVLESLQRYIGRQHYIKKSLSHLFGLTQGYSTPRVDIIKLVLAAASRYQTVFNIQMAATACLFNLSKTDIGQRLHPKILGQIVKVDLDAMETFPQYHQLQKNVLLTICNDRILQEVSFDKYRCARLVLDCLCAWHESSMNRMSVAICSILAAKISTQETSQLGSQPRYMAKLLSIVRKKVTERTIDVTLKFSLSALWNLTDESPQTCNVFLQEGGMQLFLQVLQTCSDDLSVKTKVLGLLNNIAEVQELRSHLMLDEFIEQLRELLYSNDIEVSYFAAGIAAHLSSFSIQCWTVDSISKDQLIHDLATIVTGWQNPENEMVAYRSFRPFFPLMDVCQVHAVQLWAIWAIHHVCSKNPKRYCPMLIEQGGDQILLKLLIHPHTDSVVLKLCKMVVNTLEEKKFLSGILMEGLKGTEISINV